MREAVGCMGVLDGNFGIGLRLRLVLSVCIFVQSLFDHVKIAGKVPNPMTDDRYYNLRRMQALRLR